MKDKKRTCHEIEKHTTTVMFAIYAQSICVYHDYCGVCCQQFARQRIRSR